MKKDKIEQCKEACEEGAPEDCYARSNPVLKDCKTCLCFGCTRAKCIPNLRNKG